MRRPHQRIRKRRLTSHDRIFERHRLTAGDIKNLVGQLKGIVEILSNADPEDRKAVYQELNLAVVYRDDGRMQVTAGPDACTNECVGGGT